MKISKKQLKRIIKEELGKISEMELPPGRLPGETISPDFVDMTAGGPPRQERTALEGAAHELLSLVGLISTDLRSIKGGEELLGVVDRIRDALEG